MGTWGKVLLTLVAAILITSLASVAQAGGFCRIRIESILACNSADSFDVRLRGLKRRLDSVFSYRSYRLMTRENRRINWGQPARFAIPGSRVLVVKPRRPQRGRVAMKVMLAENGRPLVGTEVFMRDDGVFLVGGPRHQEGVLIISIGAARE